MADTKISAMADAATLTGSELVPIVQGGANVKTTTQDIADLAPGTTGTNDLLVYKSSVNKTGSTILQGQLVMVNPATVVQGNRLDIMPSVTDGTYPADLLVGIASQDIADNDTDQPIYFGELLNVTDSNINLGSETWNEGDILYADPVNAGGLTNVQPTAPAIKTTIAVIKKITGPNIDLIIRININHTLDNANNVDTSSSIGTINNSDSYLVKENSSGIWKIFSWANIKTALNSLYVPLSRTLTINGTGYDLSANRSWTVSATPIGGLSTQTANYTAVLADANTWIEMNVGSANTFTVPPNSSVAFPLYTILYVSQKGSGQTSIVAGSGVTITSTGSWLKLAAQYSAVMLFKSGTDSWKLIGQLTP